MNILLTMPGFTAATLFNPDVRDHCQEPFIALRDTLAFYGHTLHTLDTWDGAPLDALICWDVPDQETYTRAVWQGKAKRKLLIVGEPPVVRPENWDTRLHDLFDRVLTWHDSLVDGVFYRKFYWPQPHTWPAVEDVPFAERRLLAHISSAKASPIAGEQYSVRRAAVKALACDLYGMGWNAADWPTYQGAPKHKADVYPRYRFALVIENQIAPGFITEKLFDAIRCGCVPVYLGAPNVERDIDPAAFIDVRAFAGWDALHSYLTAMSEDDWQAYRDCGQAFVASDAFARWLPAAFVDAVGQGIGITNGAH